MVALWANRDREQLEQAIWRHLTDQPTGFSPTGFSPTAVSTAAFQRTRRRPKARVAYAFDLWIAHLMLLEQMLEIAPIPWEQLRCEEFEGLLLLRTARERFQREYHPCAECGAPVHGKICPRCGAVG